MGVLFIFIFISVLIISALLFFNKGEKAQEIKSILIDIYENLKELFSNLKKLFLIIKELIQSKLDLEPIQLKDESSSNSSKELGTQTEDSNPDTNQSQTEVIADPVIDSASKAETQGEDSNPDTNQSQTEVIADPVIDSASKAETQGEDSINDKNMDTKND